MFEVQLISSEIVKPSSQTPPHLLDFKLTLLEQRFRRTYAPFIYFYSPFDGGNISQSVKLEHLKKSLSETLALFYPLAGRLSKDGSIIKCNDAGVDFLQASVQGRLSDFLLQPRVEVLNQLVPCSFWQAKSGRDVLMAVQANMFDCGGMAIGACVYHKIVDGSTLSTFINSWGCISRGSGEAKAPEFLSSQFFPTEGYVPTNVVSTMEKVSTKRFVFSASKIASLRAGRSKDAKSEFPSRVEAVAALIWRCMMRIQGEERSTGTFMAIQAVDLRARMSPPLPQNCFGNVIMHVVSVAKESECHGDIQRYLERKLREATRQVDGNYMRELQNPGGIARAIESMNDEMKKHSSSSVGFCRLISVHNFPWYEADFGWGEPILVCPCSSPQKNTVMMVGTRSAVGIEAWVNMECEDMAKFEKDQELLSFVTNP